MEYKFRAYSKEYGMSPACSIFDIQIMDCEGLTDMSKVELMQFTGLYDCTKWEELTEAEKKEFYNLHKSEEYKNIEDVKCLWQGREIYDGDILCFTVFDCMGDDKQYKGIVDWNNKEACFNVSTEYDYWQLGWIISQDDEVEVIGNKHDNPELLEANNG